MHRTHAGHGSIWPAETAEARAFDQSTLASRAREDALREASKVAAFGDLPQGLSGSTRDAVAKAILALIDKPKPLPAAPVDGGEDA